MYRHLFIVLSFSFFISVLTGYSQPLSDTIIIDNIIVKGRKISGNAGFKVLVIDSAMLNGNGFSSLSDVLNDNSPLYIKSYGLGSLATTSFRGTGAGHTQVMWNGISINSPMVGQSDLNLIPAGMTENVSVYYGGASLAVNSGGIGGIINTESKPEWKEGSRFTINGGTGSFGRYSSLVRFTTGSLNFQSVTKAVYNSGQNNFRYVNSYLTGLPINEIRKNAGLLQTGIMQEFYFKKQDKITSVHLWYQSANRNLPLPMTVDQNSSGEKQNDSFMRSLVTHKSNIAGNSVNYSLSWFADRLDYKNSLADIDSRNLSHSVTANTKVDFKSVKGTKISASLSDNLILVRSNNYNGTKTRNLLSASVSAGHVIGKRAGVVVLMRQNIKNNEIMIPDLSVGFDYRILMLHNLYLKGNISRNSRIPTMNDMYWNPGGNTQLKNEYSYNYEISFEADKPVGNSINVKSEVTFYNNYIHNMIQWLPGNMGYWTPENTGNVVTRGLEREVIVTYQAGNLSINANAGYTLTIARKRGSEADAGDTQLIYVPVHQVNSGTRITYRNIYFSWIFNYSGKRFTTPENDHFLPSYSLNDAVAGIKIQARKGEFDIGTRISNIMDVSYQAIAFHPMPGRSIFINLIYRFTR